MSGWSATGFRIYLGAAESQESYFDIIFAVTRTRTITQERAKWRGLTAAGAVAKTATADWRIVARDRVGESGQWEVTEEKITYGAWS